MNSTERRASALAITAQLEDLREHVRRGHEDGSLTLAQNYAATELAANLNGKLQALLTEGARSCPDCGHPAFGLMHESALGKGKGFRYTYEIGCRNAECRDCRATDLLPELAVERWNAADYDPPREPAKA